MESEIKNGDQQTKALEIDFVIDLEMYRNWQKMEIPKISIAYYQKSKCFTEILFHFRMQHSDYYRFTN